MSCHSICSSHSRKTRRQRCCDPSCHTWMRRCSRTRRSIRCCTPRRNGCRTAFGTRLRLYWLGGGLRGPASRRSRRHASPSALKAVELAAVDLAVVEATRDSAEVEPATVDDAAVHVDTTEKVIASCAAVIEQTKVPELPALDRRNSNDADLSDLPQELICPITMNLMRDPVFTCDGQTYERRAIEEWLTTHQTSPLTGAVLSSSTLTPNVTLRSYIDRLVAERKLAASAASP